MPVKFGGLRKTNPAHIKNSGVSFICTFTCTSLTSFLYYSSFYKKKYISPAYVVISFYLAMSLFQHCVAYWNFPSRAFRREFFFNFAFVFIPHKFVNEWIPLMYGSKRCKYETISDGLFPPFLRSDCKGLKIYQPFFPYSSKAHVSFQLCTRFPKNLIYSL